VILMMSESTYKDASHDFVNKIKRFVELTSKILGKDVQVD